MAKIKEETMNSYLLVQAIFDLAILVLVAITYELINKHYFKIS